MHCKIKKLNQVNLCLMSILFVMYHFYMIDKIIAPFTPTSGPSLGATMNCSIRSLLRRGCST